VKRCHVGTGLFVTRIGVADTRIPWRTVRDIDRVGGVRHQLNQRRRPPNMLRVCFAFAIDGDANRRASPQRPRDRAAITFECDPRRVRLRHQSPAVRRVTGRAAQKTLSEPSLMRARRRREPRMSPAICVTSAALGSRAGAGVSLRCIAWSACSTVDAGDVPVRRCNSGSCADAGVRVHGGAAESTDGRPARIGLPPIGR